MSPDCFSFSRSSLFFCLSVSTSSFCLSVSISNSWFIFCAAFCEITIVFAAIWSTIVVGRMTSVMITSEISTPCAWNWSLSVRRMSSATSRPFDIACAARSSSEGPATERSAASPSSSDGGASASPAPLSTFIFLPDLSVRSPYTSVCRSVRATCA